MYRLLIVDDEPYIVDWIYELFVQNEELELDIYRAYSGLEALDLLRRAKIDIVMTDINMPDMNGLQLFKEIKDCWPMCKVIFLTAYNEFEYAHIANKGGVTYLLKTESDDEIINAVKKAVNEIDSIIRQEELIKRAKIQLDKALPIMQREFLLEKLKGNDVLHISQEQLDELNINLCENDEILILMGRFDNWFLQRQAKDKMKQYAIIEAIIENFFSPFLNYAYIQLDNSIMVWMIQPKKQKIESENKTDLWHKTAIYVKGSLDSIQEQCIKSVKCSCSFVIDSKTCSWNELPQRFLSLLMVMNYGGIKSNGAILTKIHEADEVDNQLDKYSYCMREVGAWINRIHDLEKFLVSGQRKEFYSLFAEFKENLIPIIKTHSNLRTEVYFSISLLFLNYINRNENLMEKLAVHSEISNLMNINCSIPFVKVFETFEKIADIIFLYQNDSNEKRDNLLISTIHKYIEENLDKDVSLVALAEVVYLNPAYLSRVYKQVTGVNLSDYIYNIRLSKAKKMLKDSNLKVHDIARAVGFESVAYFIRAFKKGTGMTPQEYREY
ncbi:helix-turn-helix domain-containing protein [Clostridium sp. SYSU_GA19001]|uniref:response regulator transcription factor n=1 Tax=Clostridium caldaquaticum TaxID=2940653 RepID=UPI002076EE72|nr:helix-turn-helix domain-containing protein [Clostridium caldaquaticum]MCM8711522.1 helix-turn-helix domain-containing protein [Clostridium caldaquaticum]